MDSNLFEEWVREQDRKFESEGRKLVLIIDNFSAHLHIDNLKAINLVFLPPNTTSKTQPSPWIKALYGRPKRTIGLAVCANSLMQLTTTSSCQPLPF